MATRRVAWHRSDEITTDEHATLTIRDTGIALVGTVLGAEAGLPLRIEYRVMTDGAALTTAAHVRDLRGFDQRALTVERNAKGVWLVNGKADRSLKGCTDVDLGCTPSTNSLPIRRLRLGVGASQTVQAAWVRFPALSVSKAAQTYTRLDEFTYRYDSGTFSAELIVDDDGLVASYAAWQRTGIALGPDETEPLDARTVSR
ncbi:MAG TPA: putative glycolipid-binding domain-containing protein [Candidatus Limnocylindria bacterium]|nr:putative glycolipid-binding domain-containing protein [Candidatus Limnocylindria bacterium]